MARRAKVAPAAAKAEAPVEAGTTRVAERALSWEMYSVPAAVRTVATTPNFVRAVVTEVLTVVCSASVAKLKPVARPTVQELVLYEHIEGLKVYGSLYGSPQVLLTVSILTKL
jgi:hypothetical protein